MTYKLVVRNVFLSFTGQQYKKVYFGSYSKRRPTVNI